MKKRAVDKGEKSSKGDLQGFYWTVKDNAPARDAIDWEKFAEYAGRVGLHYHPVLGLMEKRVWDKVKELLVV